MRLLTFPSIPLASATLLLLLPCELTRVLVGTVHPPEQDEREEGTTAEVSQDRFSDRSSEQRERDTRQETATAAPVSGLSSTSPSTSTSPSYTAAAAAAAVAAAPPPPAAAAVAASGGLVSEGSVSDGGEGITLSGMLAFACVPQKSLWRKTDYFRHRGRAVDVVDSTRRDLVAFSDSTSAETTCALRFVSRVFLALVTVSPCARGRGKGKKSCGEKLSETCCWRS